MDLAQLDLLKAKWMSLRPLPAAALRKLHEDLVLRWTFNSNAIEGNTLTLVETKVILEGITVGGKLLREHFEAINHRDAIAYVESLASGQEELSTWQIRNLHRLVLKNVDDENAGRYRQVNVTMTGARHVPPDWLHVSEQMDALIEWYQTSAPGLHPVQRAAQLHIDFVKIHPFVDGNGRSARLLLNLELLKSGFLPVVIPVTQRMAYYEALDRAHVEGDAQAFYDLVASSVVESFAPYWHAIGIQP